MLTKKELDIALYNDYHKTIKELTENSDLLLKGNQMLIENKLSQQEYQVLQEGAWESIKYGLAKLGRYKAGGKIFGKGKIDQEAGSKIQSILDKKGNEVIKQLDSSIKQENPEFPNNKEGEKFLSTVMNIASVYDSIVAATKKDPKEEGYLPTDAANSIIADLAEYVQKFLDVDLAGAYTVMDSEEEKVKGDDSEELLTDEVEDINEDEAADTRAKLQAKAGDKTYDTKRMGKEGLKSNKLPMTLAGVGASLGAFSWLVNTEWFKSLFEIVEKKPSVEYVKQAVESKTGWFSDIKPGQGMTQLMNEMDGTNLSPSSSPEEFLAEVKKLGGGNLQEGINALSEQDGIFRSPEEAREVLNEIAKNPHGHGDTLGEIFKDKWAGTGKSMGDALVTVPGGPLKALIVKTIVTAVPKIIMKSTVKMGAGYAIAKGFASVLGPIGIGLVATGALVKIMRVKGQKQSRAKTLNDLLQSLQPVKVEGNTLPPVLPDPKPNPVTGGGEGGSGKNICNAKNLNELNKLLNESKSLSQPLKDVTKYKDDSEFQEIFLDAFINTTKSIKINKKPLLKTLQDLQSQGLLEAPTSMSGRQRKYLKIKLDLQNFMNSVMKLFAAVYKACKKTSKTFQVIKNFFKQLFLIASQGKSNISNKQAREKLLTKLIGNFSQFLSQLNKLGVMEKGSVGKTEGQPKKNKKGDEGTFAGSAPRTKPPQLAHHDRGDKFLYEEITKIKKLMK